MNVNHQEVLLSARGLCRRFGGLTAVDDVDLTVLRGSIHGLIGPNGAGKTTLVNLISGVDQADSGSVTLGGEEVGGVTSQRLARLGIARSFQTSQLFDDEDVITNVMAGRHQHVGYPLLHSLFYTRRTRMIEDRHRRLCLSILDDLDMRTDATTPVRELPYGRRRIVEVARALATEPDLLILDEPAAGLPGSDVDVLAGTLVRLASLGYTVLIIEHNIGLVMSVCDTITVLAQGRVIADGQPAAIRSDPQVIEAYLGEVAR